MAAVVAATVFAGSMAMSASAIWHASVPQWRRIAALLSGQVETPFQPLAGLVHAERRIAVRRWATMPAPAAQRQMQRAA